MRIRARLLSTYLALTGAGMLLVAVATLVSFQSYVLHSLGNDLTARATAVSQSVLDCLARDDRGCAAIQVERYGAQKDLTVRLFAPSGALAASSDPTDAERDGLAQELAGVPDALAGTWSRGQAHDRVDGGDRLFEAVPLKRRGTSLGVLRFSRALSPFQDQMQATAETIVVVLGAVFAAATLVGIRLARSLAEPVQRMRNFAVALGEGQLGERLDIRRQDELGELGTELNRMSRRLAAVDEERRAFLASASHELRTPVSNIHVTLEALESGAGEDPDLRRRFVQSALGETSRMIRMIQDLLDLGRLEAGVSVIERQRTTVQHLVDRLHRAMEPRLQDARVHVEVDVVDAPISIDTERMLQALMNILDNALKFAPPRSTVRIRTRVENACAVLSIEDEGPGIAPADLPRVFEQFWMADPARKRSGTGLGLAIARRIVESHGGTISAGSAGGRGATFTVSLPTRGEDGAIG